MKNEKKCSCKTCRQQIPLSAAKTAEGSDYTYHFCGADCYDKWFQKNKHQSDK